MLIIGVPLSCRDKIRVFLTAIRPLRNDGAAYDPAQKGWRSISTAGAPSPRWCHVALWTGREMLIWGGRSAFQPSYHKLDGGLYDPATDRWRPINLEGAPTARSQSAAVWTGSEMIVWGGWGDQDLELATGARYNPVMSSKVVRASGNAPEPGTHLVRFRL